MSMRAHLVKEYIVEYGDCIGFANDSDSLVAFLDKVGAFYYTNDNMMFEVEIESLLNTNKAIISSLTKDERSLFEKLLHYTNFDYAQKYGILRIEFI